MKRRPRAVWIALATAVAALGPAGGVLANGEVQREIQGRVVSLDARAGRLVVEREFRGKTTRLAMRVAPAAAVYACGEERPTLDRVKPGMLVSVFYEVLGAEGVANLVVVEPAR